MRKLLLFCGWGWTASSPLIYTLQRYSKYAHFGYSKTFRYLAYPYYKDGELLFKSSPSVPFLLEKHIEGTWENFRSLEPSSHRMNTTEDLQPLSDFSLDHAKRLIEGEPSISKFMDFYIALHDHVVSKGYKSVGHCGCYKTFKRGWNYYDKDADGELGQNAIREFIKTLLSEFEVKCLFLVRDPIRRAFGKYLNWMQGISDLTFRNVVKKDFFLPHELEVADYITKIDYCYNTYGKDNVHVSVMEELWEGDGTAKKELSQFLDHPIDTLWKNLYAPDIGHFVKYDKDVPCQAYGQNLVELKSDVYYELKNKYQHVYDSWRNKFGSLPLHWGEHIDYEKGKSILQEWEFITPSCGYEGVSQYNPYDKRS